MFGATEKLCALPDSLTVKSLPESWADGSKLNASASLPPLFTLSITTVAFFVFVNVQVTVPPAATLMSAEPDSSFPRQSPSHPRHSTGS